MLTLVRSTLSAMRSARHKVQVDFNPETQTYNNTQVYRGFPLATLGSGGFNVSTTGGFEDYRMHNNWMQPVKFVPGSFWAVHCANKEQRWARILRQQLPKGCEEYNAMGAIERVTFKGEIPAFEQSFHGNLPIEIRAEGFAPMSLNEPEDSTLPIAFFKINFQNLSAQPLSLAFLFSWQNILGFGGIGCGGMPKNRVGVPTLIPGKNYENQQPNRQEEYEDEELYGLRFLSGDQWQNDDLRHSTQGTHLLLAHKQESWKLSTVEKWDPTNLNSPMLEEFAQTGNIPTIAEPKMDPTAAAICAKTKLEPGAKAELDFQLTYWTPGHVVRNDSQNTNNAPAVDCVGHYYENHFTSAESVAHYAQEKREYLEKESQTLKDWLEPTSLPNWLKHMLLNASDSAICNSVVPKSGVLHTIEGVDWQWPYGGLTGTADQRLISHPFTATFFKDFDRNEIHSFVKTHKNGSVAHGNGNCDLGLESSDVPYGRPLDLHHGLKESHWPDLTMSIILQIYRHVKVNNDLTYLISVWPEILQMASHLKSIAPNGIPLGGHTFDTFKISGHFMYTAGLYLSTLYALSELAEQLADPQTKAFRKQADALAQQIQEQFWDSKEGYYKTTPDRPTLFLGSLAGDWFKHWSGLPHGLPREQVRRHVLKQHDILIKNLQPLRGRAAFSFMEAYPSGRRKANWFKGIVFAFGYASQVIAYHGLEAISLGLVDEGLETIEHLYKRITQRAYLWSSDLFGNAGPIYMSHTALWALPNLLSGAVLNKTKGLLQLSPKNITGVQEQCLPLCFPDFLGHLDWDRQNGQVELYIYKNLGKSPLKLKSIEVDGHIFPLSPEESTLKTNTRIVLKLDRQASAA